MYVQSEFGFDTKLKAIYEQGKKAGWESGDIQENEIIFHSVENPYTEESEESNAWLTGVGDGQTQVTLELDLYL